MTTSNILRGILKTRGMDGTTIAKAAREPKSTINYRIKNVDRTLRDFRMFVNVAGMTDEEIVRVVRGKV